MPHYSDSELFKVVHSSGESVRHTIHQHRFVGGELLYPVPGAVVNRLKTRARLHVFPYDADRKIVWRKPPGANRNRPFYELKKGKVAPKAPAKPPAKKPRGRPKKK